MLYFVLEYLIFLKLDFMLYLLQYFRLPQSTPSPQTIRHHTRMNPSLAHRIIALPIWLVACVQAYSSGAPDGACNPMKPEHNVNPSPLPGPFGIRLSKVTYSPLETLQGVCVLVCGYSGVMCVSVHRCYVCTCVCVLTCVFVCVCACRWVRWICVMCYSLIVFTVISVSM